MCVLEDLESLSRCRKIMAHNFHPNALAARATDHRHNDIDWYMLAAILHDDDIRYRSSYKAFPFSPICPDKPPSPDKRARCY
jgi:hypothetical protein